MGSRVYKYLNMTSTNTRWTLRTRKLSLKYLSKGRKTEIGYRKRSKGRAWHMSKQYEGQTNARVILH